jgi:predicted TIM-barrel fold metal-dependent hydrolase
MPAAHRIDVHHHVVPPRYVEAVGAARVFRQTGRPNPPASQWSVEKSLEQMDAAGIATALTSISAPGTWFGDVAQGRKLSRECNEYSTQLARDYPGRFGTLISLPLPDVEGSLREIEYGFDTLKADGVVLMTSYDSRWLGEQRYAPVFEELNRRKATVLFHPTVAPCCEALMTDIPDALVEFMFDTTRAVTNMLYSGSFTRYGDMHFIVPHCGSTVPLLKARISAMWNWNKPVAARLPKGPIHELQKLYYDTALSARPECFGPLLELVTPKNIVFGTDYPWGGMTPADTVAGVAKQGFSVDELRMIERDNALSLFQQLKG